MTLKELYPSRVNQNLTRRPKNTSTPSKCGIHTHIINEEGKENKHNASLNKHGTIGQDHDTSSTRCSIPRKIPPTRTDTNDSNRSHQKVPRTPSKSFAKKKLAEFLSPNLSEVRHSSNLLLLSALPEANIICDYKGPELHAKFREASTWDEIFTIFDNAKHDELNIIDDDGRNPLHMLGHNTHLPESFSDRSIYTDIAKLVERMNKGNCVKWLTLKDNDGNIPFQKEVKEWIKQVGIKPKVKKKSSSKEHQDDQEDIESAPMTTPDSQDSLLQNEMPTQVVYVLHLASQILDILTRASPENIVAENEDMGDVPHDFFKGKLLKESSCTTLLLSYEDISKDFVEQFAKMEHVIMTFLFLSDDHRRIAFKCSLVKRIMIRKESTDAWLVKMFQDANKNVSARAMEYITLLSDLVTKNPELKLEEEQIVEKFENLEGLMQSMLMLDKKMTEDVASTPIVTKVIDHLITTPFVATFLFFDMFFLLALLFCFRKGVDGFLTGAAKNKVLFWLRCANTLSVYNGVREFGKVVALTDFARKCPQLLWNFGTTINIISITSVTFCVFSVRVSISSDESSQRETSQMIRIWFAFTTALLWLRFLSFVKSINSTLATFVMAIVQITRDIFWYLVILIIIIVCFSQIFFTMLVPASCSVSFSVDCSPREYYLRVYTILLGDWGLFSRKDDFQDKPFALLVFVGFSFAIVIVLLSVLIAIIGNSYTRCLERSEHLLGSSRVTLLAELVAFRNARSKFDPKDAMQNLDWKLPSTAMKLCVTFIIVVGWFVIEFLGTGKANSDKSPVVRIFIALGTITANCVLFAAFILLLSQNNSDGNDNCWGRIKRKFSHIVTWLMTRLLGEGGHMKKRKNTSDAETMSAAVKQFEALILEQKLLTSFRGANSEDRKVLKASKLSDGRSEF